jgi:hypothetical protein
VIDVLSLARWFAMKMDTPLALAAVVALVLVLPPVAHSQTSVELREVSQPQPVGGDLFGRSVALEGGRLFVGSPGDVGGGGGPGGSAWVFEVNLLGEYEYVARLAPPVQDAVGEVKFGWSLDAEGERVVIGAPGASNGVVTTGRAYVFELSGGQWTLVAELDEPAGAIGDGFGEAVALSGDRILVAAPRRDGAAVDTGRVYVFERSGSGAWLVTGSFTASDAAASTLFGFDLDLEGDRAIVAASPWGNLSNKHRAYIFERTVSGAWGEVQELLGSEVTSFSSFGPPSLIVGSCALADDLAAIGSPLSPFGGTTGRVSIYRRQIAGQWLLQTIADPQGQLANAYFGASVALSADLLVVGAPGVSDDADATGAVYIFQPSGPTSWEERSKITLDTGVKYAAFGAAVDIEGEQFAAGALSIAGFTVALAHSPAVVGHVKPVATGIELQKIPVINPNPIATSPWFGFSAAADGDIAIVGSPANTPFAGGNGAVQILRRALNGAWNVELAQTLNSGAFARPGWAVATDGTTCLVGVPFSPLQPNVQVFEESSPGSWGAIWTLQPLAGSSSSTAEFGAAVDIDADRAVVGSPAEARGNGATGRAWIFERAAGGSWSAAAVVQPSGAVPGERFGSSVAISGDLLAVGAPASQVPQAAGGAVFIFERTVLGSWGQVAALEPIGLRAGDQFGFALDMSGECLVVGAVGDDQRGTESGSAFVFEREAAGTWVQRARLLASDGSSADAFGTSVAIDGDEVIIGAPSANGPIDRNGAAYLFTLRSDGEWREVIKFVGTETNQPDRVGQSVAVTSGSFLVGAPEADSTYQNGGAVFTFELGTLYRNTKALSLASGGTQALHIRADDARAGHVFVMFGSATGTSPGVAIPGTSVELPLVQDAYFDLLLTQGGARLLFPWVGVLDENGAYDARFVVPGGANASLAGLVLRHACLLIDPATFEFVDASNAVEVELVP